jgi:thiol-disulfide isomerase/thioredoxin
MKREIWLIGGIAFLFTAIGIYFGTQTLRPQIQQTPQDVAASRLLTQSLPDAGGQMQALSQWKGKTLLVNFWATWCAPCVQEMPELTVLQHDVAAKNIQIIGIGVDSAANIAEFSLKYKIGYPLYVAGMGGAELSRHLGNQVGGLPFTVLIGADGQVRKVYSGRLKLDSLRKDLASF